MLSNNTELYRFQVFNEKYWLLKETIQTKKFIMVIRKKLLYLSEESYFFQMKNFSVIYPKDKKLISFKLEKYQPTIFRSSHLCLHSKSNIKSYMSSLS